MAYTFIVRCPVCSCQIDKFVSQTKEIDGQGAAMVIGESRRQHGKDSPQCMKQDDWYKGWLFDAPIENK